MGLRGRKILVTGGAGFLGQHLVRKLIDRGVPEKDILVPRSVEHDLRVLENCKTVTDGKDIVFHLAGTTGGIGFHQNHPAQIFYNNLMIGVQLMEAARKAGVKKFITIGSATEYPESAPLPFREEDLWLGFPEPIHAPYTVAKKMLLVQAQAYRKQYGFNAVHLLLTNMYGPGQARGASVVASLIERVWRAKRHGAKYVEVWGTGKPTRDFLYVEDAAGGIVLAAERYGELAPINIASGWEISIREIAELIARLMGFAGEIRFDTSKPDGQMRRVLDATRAEQSFDFRATTDFESGLKETIAWYETLFVKEER